MTLTRNMPVEPQPLQLLLNKIKSPLKAEYSQPVY